MSTLVDLKTVSEFFFFCISQLAAAQEMSANVRDYIRSAHVKIRVVCLVLADCLANSIQQTIVPQRPP